MDGHTQTQPATATDTVDSVESRAALSFAEARLFERAAAGDRTALAEVWRSNRRWLAAILAAHAPSGVAIDDLLQEVAATLVTKCHHVRDSASLRGWLRVVAINAARMAMRSRGAERRALREHARDQSSSHARHDQGGEETRETLGLLSLLPSIYAEPLLLQSVQGLSQRQIAELLDVPETTIETRLARARRMLRQMVRELEGNPS